MHIAIQHKIGPCPVMETSIAIVISSPHRKDSLQAIQFAIDELKRTVPIWKKVNCHRNFAHNLFDNNICFRSIIKLVKQHGKKTSKIVVLLLLRIQVLHSHHSHHHHQAQKQQRKSISSHTVFILFVSINKVYAMLYFYGTCIICS